MQFPKDFTRFAKIGKHIELDKDGLKCLFDADYVSVVVLNGKCEPYTGALFQERTRRRIEEEKDSLWISSRPIYSQKLKRNLVFIRTQLHDSAYVMSRIKELLDLISSVMIVWGYESENLTYLAHVNQEQKANSQKRRQKVCSFIGVRTNPTVERISLNNDAFEQELNRQNVFSDARISYPRISGYDFPPSLPFEEMLSTLENLCDQFTYHDIMHGPILESYSQILVEQINTNGRIDQEKAEDQIQIDQDYELYLEAVQYYNMQCMESLSNDPHPELRSILKNIRHKTEKKFNSDNPVYIKKLSSYLDKKEEELIKANQELYQKHNLAILQEESQKCIKRIKKSKNVSDENVDKELEKLGTIYKSQAGGESKDRLYSEYLSLFMPIIFKEANAEASNERMKEINRENKELSKQIKQLEQAKNNKCCGIM